MGIKPSVLVLSDENEDLQVRKSITPEVPDQVPLNTENQRSDKSDDSPQRKNTKLTIDSVEIDE